MTFIAITLAPKPVLETWWVGGWVIIRLRGKVVLEMDIFSEFSFFFSLLIFNMGQRLLWVESEMCTTLTLTKKNNLLTLAESQLSEWYWNATSYWLFCGMYNTHILFFLSFLSFSIYWYLIRTRVLFGWKCEMCETLTRLTACYGCH